MKSTIAIVYYATQREVEEVSNELGNALAHSFNKRGMDWEKAKVLAAVCLSFAKYLPPLH